MTQMKKPSVNTYLNKLFSLNINTPEILVYVPADVVNQGMQEATIRFFCKSIVKNKVRTVIRLDYVDDIEYLEPKEAVEILKRYTFGEDLVILKAPTKETVYAGQCVIDPYFCQFVFSDKDNFKLAWNDKIHTSDPRFNEVVNTIGIILGSVKGELDGATIKWSSHKGNVGVLQRPILFWGI